MAIAAGTQLGRYEIRFQLGADGMGEVYLAWDSELEHRVALKVLPQDVASNIVPHLSGARLASGIFVDSRPPLK